MAHELYYPWQVNLDATMIDAITEQGLDPGAQVIRRALDGMPYAKMAHVGQVSPVVDFASLAIGDAMGAFGADPCVTGYPIAAGDIVTLYCQKGTNRAGRVAVGSSEHLKVDVNMGLAVPISIAAGNGPDPGGINVQVIPTWDGSNAPLKFTADQALAGTPAPDQAYYAGKVLLNNVECDGVQGITVNFGIGLNVRREKGQVYPTFVTIESCAPVITIVTDNIELASTYSEGVAISAATYVQLRKAVHGGTRVADATAAHPKFTCTAGLIISRKIAGSPQSMVIDILPTFDGTNAIMAYAAAAIT